MVNLLEMPEVRARVSRLSVENYEMLAEVGALNKRVELIRGLLVDKMPGSPLHRTSVVVDGFRARA